MENNIILQERWKEKACMEHGEIYIPPLSCVSLSLAELRHTEWSSRFERLMRNRLIIGAFRYEPFKTKAQSYTYPTATEAIRRICKYLEDGNTEHLVDAANMCLLEFEFGNHPNKHFTSIDDGVHCERKK